MAKEIVCHVCGFKNQPDAERCVSCGAKLEAVGAEYTAEEAASRANQQEGFSPLWVAISCVIYLAVQAVFIGALPLVIPTYDPQGFPGLAISAVVWFFGGIAVGFISPGKTFLEPAVGAVIAVAPTIAFLKYITPEAFEPSVLSYAVGGIIGVMLSLFGAFLGEVLQRNLRGPQKAR